MNELCGSCGQVKTVEKHPAFETELAGVPLVLINAVSVSKCGCDESDIDIPNLKGLKAAAAVYRVSNPQRLNGVEIKFVRKAMGIAAKNLAEMLNVAPETLSRWESGSHAMSPSNEKLLRLMVGTSLADDAPALSFDMKSLNQMKIAGFANQDSISPICLELVRFKSERTRSLEDEYDSKAA